MNIETPGITAAIILELEQCHFATQKYGYHPKFLSELLYNKMMLPKDADFLSTSRVDPNQTPGAGCTKLTTSLVNVSLKF